MSPSIGIRRPAGGGSTVTPSISASAASAATKRVAASDQLRAPRVSAILPATASKGSARPAMRRCRRSTCQPWGERTGSRRVVPSGMASRAACTTGSSSPRRTWPSEPSCCADGQAESSRAAAAKAAGSSPTSAITARAWVSAASQASGSSRAGSISTCATSKRSGVRKRSRRAS